MNYWSQGALDNIDEKIAGIAAVYWTDNKITSEGGIYVKFVSQPEENSTLGRWCEHLLSDTPAFAYVVTWDKMQPRVSNPYPTDVSCANVTFVFVNGCTEALNS